MPEGSELHHIHEFIGEDNREWITEYFCIQGTDEIIAERTTPKI